MRERNRRVVKVEVLGMRVKGRRCRFCECCSCISCKCNCLALIDNTRRDHSTPLNRHHNTLRVCVDPIKCVCGFESNHSLFDSFVASHPKREVSIGVDVVQEVELCKDVIYQSHERLNEFQRRSSCSPFNL